MRLARSMGTEDIIVKMTDKNLCTCGLFWWVGGHR